jgi:5-methylcytosine-specific restriction endonuclease McrA
VFNSSSYRWSTVALREELYRVQSGRCHWCNRRCRLVRNRPRGNYGVLDATLDHVVPVSRGGETTVANCVMACWKCNHDRGDGRVGG